MNQKHCDRTPITTHPTRSFEEFPEDTQLDKFDLSDRKFVALSRTHSAKPPILNAVDSDWQEFESILAKYVHIQFLCPDYLASTL
ncbi:MAG: hypothetical protein AAGF01_29660 [Cyanobacteria bacterium P01_G01_bin.38]